MLEFRLALGLSLVRSGLVRVVELGAIAVDVWRSVVDVSAY